MDTDSATDPEALPADFTTDPEALPAGSPTRSRTGVPRTPDVRTAGRE